MLTVLITLLLQISPAFSEPVWISENLPALIQLYNKNGPDAEVILYSVEKYNEPRGKEIRDFYLQQKLNLDTTMPRLGINPDRTIGIEEAGEKLIIKKRKAASATLQYGDKNVVVKKTQPFAEIVKNLKDMVSAEKFNHANVALTIVLLSKEYVEGEWGNFVIRKNTKRYTKHCEKLLKRKSILKDELIGEIKFRQKLLAEWKPMSLDDSIALPLLEGAANCYQQLLTQHEKLKKEKPAEKKAAK